jgi:hypothetical protein
MIYNFNYCDKIRKSEQLHDEHLKFQLKKLGIEYNPYIPTEYGMQASERRKIKTKI